jgi:hypothetical protein
MKKLNAKESQELIDTLRRRFNANLKLHKGIEWDDVEKKLKADPTKLASLWMMEDSGGEPDIIAFDKKTKEYLYVDMAPESPKGRRSLCYDEAALKSRKENKPKGSALGWCQEVGVEILDANHYQELQKLVPLDLKTSSWVLTPEPIRKLGGAIFGDRRYDTVFIFHNGAESYYGDRGFRTLLRL